MGGVNLITNVFGANSLLLPVCGLNSLYAYATLFFSVNLGRVSFFNHDGHNLSHPAALKSRKAGILRFAIESIFIYIYIST